ncbi:uncharacterized protein VTP21DRAFT_7282 [Calcarisporiella thermophila]|uniref:uncharacterized protein n=1 Tax=Calcarisporiella thermophila TaxID=911321 RepID=UPI003743693A
MAFTSANPAIREFTSIVNLNRVVILFLLEKLPSPNPNLISHGKATTLSQLEQLELLRNEGARHGADVSKLDQYLKKMRHGHMKRSQPDSAGTLFDEPRMRAEFEHKRFIDADDILNEVNIEGIMDGIGGPILDLGGILRPIVQIIVDGTKFYVDRSLFYDMGEKDFKTHIWGSITNTGPIPATFHLEEPLKIYWKERLIAYLKIPDLSATPGVGVVIDNDGHVDVANANDLRDFVIELLHERTTEWRIFSDKVTVKVLGFTVKNIKVNKHVDLDGADGLRGRVKVKRFELPGDDPAGGVKASSEAEIRNPSTIGLELSKIDVHIFSQDVFISDGTGRDVTLEPKGSSVLKLEGRLFPQTSQQGLQVLSKLFSNYLSSKPNPLVFIANRLYGRNGEEISYLSQAFRTLRIETSLPGVDPDFKVVRNINIKTLDFKFTPQTAYAPLTSSDSGEAQFQIPFPISFSVKKFAANIIAGGMGEDIGTLNVPLSDAVMKDQNTVALTLTDVPLNVFPDKHAAFQALVKSLALEPVGTLSLHGTTDAVANTPLGTVNLTGIPFSQDLTLKGLNGLKDPPSVVNSLIVNRGTKEALYADLDATLTNPSDVSFTVGDVYFRAVSDGQVVGTVLIPGLVLSRGSSNVKAQLEYSPKDPASMAAGAKLLQSYLEGNTSDAFIAGFENSTNIESLLPALSSVNIPAKIRGTPDKLIKSGKVHVAISSLFTNKGYASVILANYFKAPFTLQAIRANVLNQGKQIGFVDTALNPEFTVPPRAMRESPWLPVQLIGTILELIFLLLRNLFGLTISMDSTVMAKVQDYSLMLQFRQDVRVTFDIRFNLFTFNPPFPNLGGIPKPIIDVPFIFPTFSLPFNLPTFSLPFNLPPLFDPPTPTSNPMMPTTTTSYMMATPIAGAAPVMMVSDYGQPMLATPVDGAIFPTILLPPEQEAIVREPMYTPFANPTPYVDTAYGNAAVYNGAYNGNYYLPKRARKFARRELYRKPIIRVAS